MAVSLESAAASMHYIELSPSPIRFDAVSQLTNVFFDDSNKQIFAVRSGGAIGVSVKGPVDEVISFRMADRGPIRSIKFCRDNSVLAVQRSADAVEFICFQNGEPQMNNVIVHQIKVPIFGFVWVHQHECALITNTGVELFMVMPERRQLRSLKSLNISVKWFAWCAEAHTALICTSDTGALIPVLIKSKTITKLQKLDLGNPDREVQESKITLGVVYGTMAVLILQTNAANGMMEVEVFLLNGPGLAPRKCHVLRLGLVGRFALNTLDNLIVVHHQASATTLLFDISLSGEVIDEITHHSPVTPGRSLRPFALKVPSLIPEGQTVPVDLYSPNWVLFQPNIVIDAKLGCMWYLDMCIEPFCTLISDRIRLTEFLLQRKSGKAVLLKLLKELTAEQYSASMQPVLISIFNKINAIYGEWMQSELRVQMAQPLDDRNVLRLSVKPTVLIEQSDMCEQVFQPIAERPYLETVLMLYMQSLNQHKMFALQELTSMLIKEMIRNGSFDTLRTLVEKSLLLDSKPTACLMLTFYRVDPVVSQLAVTMLTKIKATENIVEVLLEQGQVVDALRMARNIMDEKKISPRKYLEAAKRTNDFMVFHTVYKFFYNHNDSGDCSSDRIEDVIDMFSANLNL